MSFTLRKRQLWKRVVRFPLMFVRHLRITPRSPLLCWRLSWLTIQ